MIRRAILALSLAAATVAGTMGAAAADTGWGW